MIVSIYYCPEEVDKGDYLTPVFRVCVSHSRQSLTITTHDRYIWAVCCGAPRRMRALNQGIFTSGAGQSWQSYLCVRRGGNHLDWKKVIEMKYDVSVLCNESTHTPSPKIMSDFFRHKKQHDAFMQIAQFLVDLLKVCYGSFPMKIYWLYAPRSNRDKCLFFFQLSLSIIVNFME